MRQLLFFLLISLSAMGQNDKSGVYLTFNDYLNNKLAYEIDCKTETHDIRQNDFANQPNITVFHNGQKIKLKKDSIYGFISCDAPLIRFISKYEYSLAEKGKIWIFYRTASISQGKSITEERAYFFATKGDGDLIELTADNIKRAFPDNPKLHKILDVQFQGKHICEYDPVHKMFKINHLLSEENGY